MTADAKHEAFWNEIDALHGRASRLDAREIALIARKTGLGTLDALREIRRQTQFGNERSTGAHDALCAFVSALGKPKARILEYTCLPALLTAPLADNRDFDSCLYVSPDRRSLDALSALFEGGGARVLGSIESIDAAADFDLIVCQPPLGGRSPESDADGFGGELVRQLVPFARESTSLLWVTARGVLTNTRAKKTLSDLRRQGLFVVAQIECASGVFPGTLLEGVVIVFRREPRGKKLVGLLRDVSEAEPMASTFMAGASKKTGPSWTWLDAQDERSFSQIEQARLLQKIQPRGRYTAVTLASLLADERIEKADRPVPEQAAAAGYIFVPEYPGSRVTTDLADQTVSPKAVYRFALDPGKANSRFLAQLLNSPYGRALRASVAQSATIQRSTVSALPDLELPIPDLATQEKIARIDSDIGLLQSTTRDIQSTLDQDWNALPDVAEKIDRLKAVLDIEHQIADWWLELPYPLATIYRRYQVSTEPKERLETLLHFFEMAAVYLAAIGTSHVKAMRQDWEDVIAKLLHPAGLAGIERTDFGFWLSLASASLKNTSRIASDKELTEIAVGMAGPELVQVARIIGPLGRATEVLDKARRYRNSWKGHGGHVKAADAERLDRELQQTVRDLYEIAAPVFRRFKLVRPGMGENTGDCYRVEIQKLSGSDPTFEKEKVELDRMPVSHALAFWMNGTRSVCRALPFFRLGAPQQPQENSFYVFNRVENGGFRWICYQEAREQEFTAPDDELANIIALGKRAG